MAGGRRQGWPAPLRAPAARQALLGVLLLALTAAVLAARDLPVAAPNPALAVATASLAGALGLVVLYLGLVRFGLEGLPRDLYVGTGFGLLALANLLGGVAVPAAGWAGGAAALGLLLLLSALAAGLFALPLLRPGAVVPRAARRGYGLRLGGAVAASLALGALALRVGSLPPALDREARQRLTEGATVRGFLPGQAPWLLAATGAVAALLLLATVGHAAGRGARRGPGLWPVVPLLLLTGAQIDALLFPPVAPGYVSTATGLRLAGYLALLALLVDRHRRDYAARAGEAERRRLARELHDGLLQLLHLLGLHLDQARRPGRDTARWARDLEAAARTLEAAILEARQAVVALRASTVTWAAFAAALRTFAEEFAARHQVAVEPQLAAAGPPLDGALQATVLRIAHEACANAVRHGGAGHIVLAAAPAGPWLVLRVADDGCGFDPRAVAAGPGLGLRSFAERAAQRGGTCEIQAAPGRGATVLVHLALDPGRRG